MKPVQYKVNSKRREELDSLIELIGLRDTFGEDAKTIEFSITFALKWLPKIEKVLPSLNGDDLVYFNSSIKRLRDQRKNVNEFEKAQEKLRK